MNLGDVCTGQAALQVQHAGKTCVLRHPASRRICRLPFQLQLALHIRIAKTQARHAELDVFAVDLPLNIARQLVQCNHRFIEDAR